MGLISYIKEHYYNSRLNKADRLLSEGDAFEAEQIYNDILDKQPLAASRLTEYYYSTAQKSNVSNVLDLFKNAIDIEKKASCVYDVDEYNKSLVKFNDFILSKAQSFFSNGSFSDACKLLSVVNSSKFKSELSLDLYCESKINLLYSNLKTVKILDISFREILKELSNEWVRGKNIYNLVNLTNSFCNELEFASHLYISNSVLAITKIDGYQTRCLDNATLIVSGRDVDISLIEQKEIVSKYGKNIILRNGLTSSESTMIFMDCWKASNDVKVIMDVLNCVTDKDKKEAFIDCVFKNHKLFLSDRNLFESFSLWINDELDNVVALSNLEKIHALGYNVELLYTSKLSGWLNKISIDEQVNLLDHAQSLYPNSSKIIALKLECARIFESRKENDKAIKVADSISQKCNDAYIVKAKALCNEADSESNLDKKEALYREAENAIATVSNTQSSAVENRINKTLLSVAKGFYSNNETGKAYELLSHLGNKGFEESVVCITKYKLSEIKVVKSCEDKLFALKNAIDFISSFKYDAILQCVEYQSLWNEKANATLEFCKEKNNDQAVDVLEQFVKEVNAEGFEVSVNNQLTKSVIAETIKRKYLIARDLELSKQFDEASAVYKNINSLEAKRTPTLSALRFILCKLKLENYQDIIEHKDRIYTLLRNSADAFKSEKEDIAYRFALVLLKSGEDKEALTVLNDFLPSEEHLKKACEQGDMIKAQAKLEDFNNKLEAVKNRTLSSDDAIYFINHMLEYAEIIKPILNISRPTLSKYRNKLKNYAIYKLFDEERYNVAFEKMLKEHSDYLEDLSALRNIALLCLNMAESKQITQSNYKDVISVWLTAIYQEMLFVKSLDYTSWDDQFTFSLYDAYGHFNEDTHEDLPDNVNFDDFEEQNVVSIKEVQRSLLDRFEAAISENQDFHNFLSYQKDAMDSFIALNLDKKCKIVAPYLALANKKVFEGIAGALEHDREREYDNWEDVLSVGAIYQMSKSIYNDYRNAKSNYDACMDNLESFNTSRVNTIFDNAKTAEIKKFDKLYTALISSVNSKVSALSANNKIEFTRNFNFYLVVCKSINDRTLSFNFSNYIMSFVVGQVNDKQMRLSKAADYILSAYTLDPTNTRVKENLKTLFEMLCQETTTDNVTAIKGILLKVKSYDSSFYNTLDSEYKDAEISKKLNSIVDNVNNHKMTESYALSEVYKMYESRPNHPGVCNNLAQLSQICIMKYIVNDEYGSDLVKTILNKLKNNKSAEFRKHSSVFRKAYNDIWNQLPYETQQLLSGGISSVISGISLNSNGIALKNGLNLMKELSSF